MQKLNAAPMKRTLVVCAYNEEKTIHRVLGQGKRLMRRGLLDDFLVVNDHSEDRTADVVRDAGVWLVENEWFSKRGKSGAWLVGLKHCFDNGTKIMVNLDADLVSAVAARHVEAMVRPIAEGRVKMTVLPVDEGFDKRKDGCVEDCIIYSQLFSGSRAISMEELSFLKNYLYNKGEDDPKVHRFLGIALESYGPELALEDRFRGMTERLPFENGKSESLVIRNLRMDRREGLFAEQREMNYEVQKKYRTGFTPLI
jgi:glycosyltransferase involved in cell wall biosynthesis